MSKRIIVLLFATILLTIVSCTQKENKLGTASNDKNKVVLGVIDSLYSNILNEQRKIWVYTPRDTTQKYPMLVLLDGDGHFSSVAGLVQQLSTVNGNTQVPEMVIVAITNTDRRRDLTPTHVREIFGDTVSARNTGGGENFTRFIKDELFPYVEKKYPVTTYRTLIGHSLGGLFAINTLLHHPEMFSNYLAIDPSMWWDKRKLTDQAKEIMKGNAYAGKSLFVGIANTMPDGMPYENLRTDTSEATYHMRSILDFVETVAKTNSGITFHTEYYPDDDHSSVPLISTYEGLRIFYSWYTLKGINQYFDKSFKATSEDLIAKINTHYQNVSEHFGYAVLPPESKINGLGYGFLGNKMPEKAYACFNLNIQNHPNSGNVFDSMGDYYLSQKDTTHAKEFFQKAMSIQKNDATADKLAKLEKK